MYDIWIKYKNFQSIKISFGGKDVNDLIKQIKEDLKPDFDNVDVNPPLVVNIIETTGTNLLTTDPAILTRLNKLEANQEKLEAVHKISGRSKKDNCKVEKGQVLWNGYGQEANGARVLFELKKLGTIGAPE
ncbi:9971_t:CDS:2, partial [Funneliformis mosseae]